MEGALDPSYQVALRVRQFRSSLLPNFLFYPGELSPGEANPSTVLWAPGTALQAVSRWFGLPWLRTGSAWTAFGPEYRRYGAAEDLSHEQQRGSRTTRPFVRSDRSGRFVRWSPLSLGSGSDQSPPILHSHPATRGKLRTRPASAGFCLPPQDQCLGRPRDRGRALGPAHLPGARDGALGGVARPE